jgi:hypothetical protein
MPIIFGEHVGKWFGYLMISEQTDRFEFQFLSLFFHDSKKSLLIYSSKKNWHENNANFFRNHLIYWAGFTAFERAPFHGPT